MLLHYSGHGSKYGPAECICPLDSATGSWPETIILDHELHAALYVCLPDGVRCVCIFDCCHSGKVMLLDIVRAEPVALQLHSKIRYMPPPAPAAAEEAHASPMATSALCKALVHGSRLSTARNESKLMWAYSACQDGQLAADAYIGDRYQGAFTWAFLEALKSGTSQYLNILEESRAAVVKYDQTPALETTCKSYLKWQYLAADETSSGTRAAVLGSHAAMLGGAEKRCAPWRSSS